MAALATDKPLPGMAAARALARGSTLSDAVLAELPYSTECPPLAEPKFSPLTHCALCGKMFGSIAVSVRNRIPIQYTTDHVYYWDEPVCDCQ